MLFGEMRNSCSLFLIVQCNNMFTKHTDILVDVPVEKRFRRACLDLAIGNELSAARTARLGGEAVGSKVPAQCASGFPPMTIRNAGGQ